MIDNSNRTYGEKLNRIRAALHISQNKLAGMLRIRQSSVVRLERGDYLPSMDTARKIDEIYASLFKEDRQLAIEKETGVAEGNLFEDLVQIVDEAKDSAVRAVNYALTHRNYLVGKRIREEILTSRAQDYGKSITSNLSEFLTEKYGRGFEKSALYSYVQFHDYFPNIFHARGKSFLSWTHYRMLITIENDNARSFYEKEALSCGWSVRELQRAINTQYYERLLSTQKGAVDESQVTLAHPQDPDEYIKNPVVAEFLGLPDPGKYNESELEDAIIAHLQQFLLELGKGYCFVERQKRMHTEKRDDYVDLVFYNRILRCFVLIDLKINKIEYQDVGQMDMYVQMFDKFIKEEDDNPTLGILLCAETDDDVARYSIDDKPQLYAAKYRTMLPDKEDFKREIDREKARFLLTHAEKKKKRK